MVQPQVCSDLDFEYSNNRLLGDVGASLLATGPKDRGFEPGQGDEFLRAIKIRSTPSSRMGSKAGMSHVVRFYRM
jgi:hypothetical protein